MKRTVGLSASKELFHLALAGKLRLISSSLSSPFQFVLTSRFGSPGHAKQLRNRLEMAVRDNAESRAASRPANWGAVIGRNGNKLA